MKLQCKWKQIIAASMLAAMAANGCAVYAAGTQPDMATPETAQSTDTATPETAADASHGMGIATFALDDGVQVYAADTANEADGTTLTNLDFTKATPDKLSDGWKTLGENTEHAMDYNWVKDPDNENTDAFRIYGSSNSGRKRGLSYDLTNFDGSDYRYLTITEKIYIEPKENSTGQFCLLYLFDSKNDPAYTLYAYNAMEEYHAHVGGKDNAKSLGKAEENRWQTITYTIDLWRNCFSVFVDGELRIENAAARKAASSFSSLQIYTQDSKSDVCVKSVTVTAKPDDTDYSKGDDSRDIDIGVFTPAADTYYGSATFYDYYGDYERAGNKLSSLYNKGHADGIATMQDFGAYAGDPLYNDQSAKLWNTVISDYFYGKDITVDPLYFGGGRYFDNGYGKQLIDSYPLYNFDMKRTGGNGKWYSGVTNPTKKDNAADAYFPNQGIAADALDANGQLLLNTQDGKTPAPYFNKDFVRNTDSAYGQDGPNGQVYENVSFPFTWDEGTSTWLFDSTQDGAQLKQDQESNSYFIDRSGQPVKYANANYFFPFNKAGQEVKGDEAYKLNYMFGMQLELPFNLTADKMSTAIDENGKEKDVNTVFRFAGDDDIWVYIDGHLVLDMGGSHGTVAGAIDFTTGKYMVSGKWDGQSTTAAAMSNKDFWNETKNGITEEYIAENKAFCDYGNLADKLGGQELTTGVRHTIQIFYMERGWDQSNLKMSFNFSQDSRVTVTKTTDLSGMNKELFADVYDEVTKELRNVAFPFGVKNQRTFDNNNVIENSELESAIGKVYTHKAADGTAQEKELGDTGVLELKDGEQAIFSNQFAYDSYLQVAEQQKEGDTRFTPTWSLTETSLTGQTVPVTKGQAQLADDDEPQGGSDTQLKDVPGTTPFDKRETEVSRNPADAKSLLLRPYGNEGEKVGVQIDFTNHLLVGELTLNKQLADGTLPTKDRFTLLVKFEDVAGVKGATQYATVTLDPDNHYTETLTGIPYGTKYTVYEVKQEGWKLEKILPKNSTNSLTEVDGQPVYDLCHTGTIAAEADKVEITFQNSRVPLPVPTPATTPKPVVITTPDPPTTTPPTTPAQTPANTPAQTPTQPTQTPVNTPAQTPTQPTQTPATPTQTPAQPTQTPVNTPTQTPAGTPTTTPPATPTQAPTATPTQTPAETPAPTATPAATATPAPTSTPSSGTTFTPEPAQTPTATAVPIPQTADSFPLFLLGVLTLCSAGALFGLLWYGRKKKF